MEQDTVASGCLLVADLKTEDRYQSQITIEAKKNGTNVGSYTFNSYREWYFAPDEYTYSFSGSIYPTDDTLVFDLNQVVKDVTPDTVTDYEWFVTIKDKVNDSKPLWVNNLRIKRNGTCIGEITEKNQVLNGSEKTFSFESVRNIGVDSLCASKESVRKTERDSHTCLWEKRS